jgi:hypothetical protein
MTKHNYLTSFFAIAVLVLTGTAYGVSPESFKGYKKTRLVISEKQNQLTVSDLESGFKLESTGGDPHLYFKELGDFCSKEKPYVIAFEYLYAKEAGTVELFCWLDGVNGHIHYGDELKKAESWTWCMVDISKQGEGHGAAIKRLRMDPPQPGISIRNICLIEADNKFLQRAAAGKLADSLDQLGIDPKGIKADACGVDTVRHSDARSTVVVRSVYGHLDLDARSKALEKGGHVKPLVPLGPVMAAGEGEHPGNHTVVRILSKYQLREAQFLAYPPEVRGGVGVNAVTLDGGASGFVCHPLMDKNTGELRLFNRYGGLLNEIEMPKTLSRPYAVASGDFLKTNPGDEIAVCSRYRAGPVVICAPSGKILAQLEVGKRPAEKRGLYHLAVINAASGSGGLLLYQDIENGTLSAFDGLSAFTPYLSLDGFPEGARVFESAFSDRLLNAGGQQNVISTLYSMTKKKEVSSQDIGLRENSFRYRFLRQHGAWYSEWPRIPDTKYVQEIEGLGSYHQAQDWSQVPKTGKIKKRTRDEWLKGIDWSGPKFRSMKEYAEGPLTFAESPNFSHRWRIHTQKALMDRLGEQGLPLYLCLSRKNETISTGYFGTINFTHGTYNFEQPELQDFYHMAQWEYFRQLAREYRKNAKNLFVAKPSHENEVVSGQASFGDYNLSNIKGFYRYLLALYGSLENINKLFGTPYADTFFDPPRNFMRGEWDRYADDNELFQEWIEYQRITVYRSVGEALLGVVAAGIPPQLARTHQIPNYASGGTVGRGGTSSRITPVDWFLTAGTGFGFTRYGLWFENRPNMAQGSWSSGFDDTFNGEFANKAETADAEKGWEQLKYSIENGMKGALVMSWPDEGLTAGYNETQYAAMQRLHKEYGNKPFPGLAGGVSSVRGYRGESGTYDIAALGCADKNTGLLKSIKADGSFEGTVYVVPFHSHVDITLLADKRDQTVGVKPVLVTEPIDVRQGCAVEIAFNLAAGQSVDELDLLMYHKSIELKGQATVLKNIKGGRNVRVTYKFPVIMSEVSFAIVSPKGSVSLENLQVYRHQDMAANLTKNIPLGERHKGGVTFDVIE